MKWLDAIPWAVLAVAAILLGLAPFGSTPHLLEKLRMLLSGTLRRPLDWFDLLMHGAPLLLLIAKAIRALSTRGA